MTTPDKNSPSRLTRVGRPAKVVTLAFEPVQPPDGPVTDGPLVRVGRPAKRAELTFEPVAYVELELALVGGADVERMFAKLRALVGKLNELEALFDRPGVWVDGERSGVRDGKVRIVLAPNDPADAVGTCKRVADQLFAAVRTVAGVTVRVMAADSPGKPVYELAA